MTLFDLFVMVDWSANSKPKCGADSIWAATLDVTTGDRTVVNHRTRADAHSAVRSVLLDAAGKRVLVGFDFPYGFPAGFARTLAGESGDWRSVWRYLEDEIVDDDRNANNRYEVAARLNSWIAPAFGPFWGCPVAKAGPTLHTHKRHVFPVTVATGQIEELRVTERRLRAEGRRPFSVWQAAYTGSVGSQALLGIPVVARLFADEALVDRSSIWPFTTGFTNDPTGGAGDRVVHAEIWPGVIDLDRSRHDVKGATQVIGLCDHFAQLDAAGRLGALFMPELDPQERDDVVAEEGWILGVQPAIRESSPEMPRTSTSSSSFEKSRWRSKKASAQGTPVIRPIASTVSSRVRRGV